MIVYEKRVPTIEEYNRLRVSVGWGEVPVDIGHRALAQTLFGVCAFHENQIIGSGRIVGDGGLAFYIQDVMVLPEFQHHYGVGSQMMNCIFDYIHAHAFPFSDVGGMAARGQESFYKRFGCLVRPNETMGAGISYQVPERSDR